MCGCQYTAINIIEIPRQPEIFTTANNKKGWANVRFLLLPLMLLCFGVMPIANSQREIIAIGNCISLFAAQLQCIPLWRQQKINKVVVVAVVDCGGGDGGSGGDNTPRVRVHRNVYDTSRKNVPYSFLYMSIY